MDLKALKDIPSSFSLAKRSLMICLIISLLVTGGSLYWSFMISKTFTETTFVLTEDGRAAFARRVTSSEVDSYRKPEIINHAKTFHKLFWEFDQFSYERKIGESLYLIGATGKQLYLSLKAQGHYSTIESQNLVQKLEIDSIKIDDKSVPYQGVLYGKLKVNRVYQKSESVDKMTATFDLHNVSRTEKNPHGLLIENYNVKTQVIKTN